MGLVVRAAVPSIEGPPGNGEVRTRAVVGGCWLALVEQGGGACLTPRRRGEEMLGTAGSQQVPHTI